MIRQVRPSSADWETRIQGIDAALRRAALRARDTARRSGTPLVIYRDGKVCKETVTDEADFGGAVSEKK